MDRNNPFSLACSLVLGITRCSAARNHVKRWGCLDIILRMSHSTSVKGRKSSILVSNLGCFPTFAPCIILFIQQGPRSWELNLHRFRNIRMKLVVKIISGYFDREVKRMGGINPREFNFQALFAIFPVLSLISRFWSAPPRRSTRHRRS